MITQLDELVSWCRKNSLWPMPFATACCGIELMATGASRHDMARFGAEVFRFSPRQCDLMIVAGRVVMKMLPVLQRIWQQMHEPKWCISMGACASTGGVFDTYSVVQGIDRFMPVDMYVPGCPPRPEQLIQAIIDLQEKIQREGTIVRARSSTRPSGSSRSGRRSSCRTSLRVSVTRLLRGDRAPRRGEQPLSATRRWKTSSRSSGSRLRRVRRDPSASFAARRAWSCRATLLFDVLQYPEGRHGFDCWSTSRASTTWTTAARRTASGWSTCWLETETTERIDRARDAQRSRPDRRLGDAAVGGGQWLEREVWDMFGIRFDGPSRPAADPAARGVHRPSAAQGLSAARPRRAAQFPRADSGRRELEAASTDVYETDLAECRNEH